jgi:hypothetical protein
MAMRTDEPPQWDWAQLDAALAFMGADRRNPLHAYLLDGLRQPEALASPEAFLRELMSVVVLLAGRGEDIDRLPAIPWSASPSSSC